MNCAWFNLLADGDGWGNIIVVIVIVVIALVSGVVQKIKEKYEVEQAQRKVEEAKRRNASQSRTAGQDRQADAAKPTRAQPLAAERPEAGPATRARPGQRRRRPATPAQQAIAALRRALVEGTDKAPEPPPTPPPAPRAPLHPPAPAARRPAQPLSELGEGVIGEVHRGEKHLSAEETQRKRRIGQVSHLHPGIVTTSAGPAGSVEEPRQRIIVDLGERKTAMHGIIFSEILGPPKALRTGPESWDL